MKPIPHIRKESKSILADPNDVSKGIINIEDSLIKYQISDSSGYREGRIKNNDIKSLHYEITPNMNVRTIVWVLLGVVLAALIYLSVDSLVFKMIGTLLCAILVMSLLMVNSAQSKKSHLLICSTKSEIVFPLKNGSSRKKELSGIINAILEMAPDSNKRFTKSNIHLERIVRRSPTTPNG